MVTTEDGRRYTLSWHSTDETGKVNGFSHSSTDLVLTGYRPNGSAVVNWTSNIRSYAWTQPLDLALDADGNPLVLFLAGSSSCSTSSCLSDMDIEFPNPEHDILASEACTTLYSSNTECQGWGERKKLVLASFGEEGLVQWTQHVMHRAGNSTNYYQNPGEEDVSWSSYDARQTYSPDGRGMMDDDYLSIALMAASTWRSSSVQKPLGGDLRRARDPRQQDGRLRRRQRLLQQEDQPHARLPHRRR